MVVLAPVQGTLVGFEPDRDGALDLAAQAVERVGKIVGSEAGPDGRHPAADVDPHGGGRHRILHGDHASDGGALTVVDVRHRCDVVEDPGQTGDVAKLVEGDGLDLGRIGPGDHVDGTAFDPLHGRQELAHQGRSSSARAGVVDGQLEKANIHKTDGHEDATNGSFARTLP